MGDTTLETVQEAREREGGSRTPTLASAAWHCHRGQWHRGLAQLKAMKRGRKLEDLPVLFASYLGHAIARCERDYPQAEQHCRRGVEAAFYRPETHWNLASVLLLARDVEGARRALADGLALDPESPLLLQLREEIEARSAGPGSPSLLDWLRRVLGGRRG